MAVTKGFMEEAAEIVRTLEQRAKALVPELQRVKEQAAKLEAEINTARVGQERLLSYHPMHNGDPQCPRCFITRGVEVTLKQLPDTNPIIERFICGGCGHEFVISSR